MWLIDEEIAIETQNPSEIMHYELTRSHGREVVDKDLKPKRRREGSISHRHVLSDYEENGYGHPKLALEVSILAEL